MLNAPDPLCFTNAPPFASSIKHSAYFAMLKAFRASKTRESPSQQGLGLPKSVFKFGYFAEIGSRV